MLWFGFAIVVAMTLLLISFPLVRQYRARSYDRLLLNKSVYLDRKTELQLELEQGVIDEGEFEALDHELQRTLLTDVSVEQVSGQSTRGQKWVYWASLISIPVAGVALYVLVSDWREVVDWHDLLEKGAAFEQSDRSNLDWVQSLDNEDILLLLRTQLKYDANNPARWLNYGQTLGQIKAFNEAIKAIENAVELAAEDLSLQLNAARTLMEFNTDNSAKRARAIVDSILSSHPNHEAALAISGFIYKRLEQYQQAVDTWQRLISNRAQRGIEEGEGVALIKNQIKMAKDLIAQQQHLTAMSSVIRVTVTLSESVVVSAKDTAKVFVIVRGNDGNPAPVAVKSYTLASLPDIITLSDQDAMMAGRMISDMSEVSVIARLSQTGQATRRPGDWTSEAVTVSTNETSSVVLKIELPVELN